MNITPTKTKTKLAGVLNSLGTEVHLIVQKGKALREFDPMISNGLDAEMMKAGIMIHRHTNGLAKVVADASGKKNVTTHSGDTIYGVDVVLMAAGRVPNTEDLCVDCKWAPNTQELHLECCGAKVTPRKYIIVDEYQNTNVENIYALGVVCGRVELTPRAIAAGRMLADRLFSGKEERTCGLTELQAVAKYGQDNIKVYTSKFANLFYGIFDMEPDQKSKIMMKVICTGLGLDEKVVGIHVLGMGCSEELNYQVLK